MVPYFIIVYLTAIQNGKGRSSFPINFYLRSSGEFLRREELALVSLSSDCLAHSLLLKNDAFLLSANDS